MKTLNSIYLGLALLAGAAFCSCQADMKEPEFVTPEASMKPNTTILELKNTFADKTLLCPMKDEVSQTPYIIHGRVVSSDASGNIYKSLVIQDETAALAISLERSSTYVDYRIGQDVVVNVTGMYVGYYNGLQQLGWLSDPYDGEAQLGFMAYDIFKAHTEKNGLPDNNVAYVTAGQERPADQPYCILTNLGSLPSGGEDMRGMQSQLVEFRQVRFKSGGRETFAPYHENKNDTLVDASGNFILVRNSGYSNFYNDTVPAGEGRVRGILSYYGSSWQLVLRDRADVMIYAKGQENDPYTVAEADSVMNQGDAGWVKGYVVGSVAAGVQSVTSASDVIFSANADLNNNVMIADSPDEKDYTKCLVVNLPQGSDLRRTVNLINNPDVYKKRLDVYGNLNSLLGLPGVSSSGAIAEFKIDGKQVRPLATYTIGSYLSSSLTSMPSDWTFDNVKLGSGMSYVWSWKQQNNLGYLNGNAYLGSPKEAESYAISPVIDLTGYQTCTLTFDHAAKFQTTLRQLCGVCVREVGATTWTQLTIPVWPTAGVWTFVNCGTVSLSGFDGKKIQVAFKYGSSSSGADTWEIRNLVIKGLK